MATTWAYDGADRLTVVEHRQTAGGTVLFSATSTYDAVGRRTQQVHYDPARATGGTFGLPTGLPLTRGGPSLGAPGGLPAPRGGPSVGPPGGLPASRSTVLAATTVQAFQYDPAGRLVQETRDGFGTASWTYDPAGNRLEEKLNGVTTHSYAYDADNRLTSKTSGGQTTTFTYDKNGSLLQSQRPGQTMIYGWDAAGRLTGVIKDVAAQATFAYDGDGVRTSKTSGGQTTTYVNDARGLPQVLQETKGTNTVSYVPGVGQHDPSKPAGAPPWGYTLADAQNSRLLVDGAGALGHRWEWEPFGKARADVGSTTSPFSYGGE